MKRIFLLCSLLVGSILGTFAGEISDFWSVKAGVNFAAFTNSDYTSECQVGFNVGALRAFAISNSVPLYLQSGLSFEMKGAKNSYRVDGVKIKSDAKSYALEVPLLINYGIVISKKSTIHPFAGIFYSFAVAGDITEGGNSTNPYKKRDVVFDDNINPTDTRLYRQSDFGVRFGLDYKLNSYSIGVAYDAGLINMYAKEFRDRNYEASTSSFSINLGYYF
ncbi:MAG: outer membrane beta-barrel protein [Rikenellaceae bacterium]